MILQQCLIRVMTNVPCVWIQVIDWEGYTIGKYNDT